MKPISIYTTLVRRALPAFAAAIVLHPGAARAQSRAEQLLSDKPAPRHNCSISPAPGRLPALAQIADSAALAAAIADFAQRYPIRDGGMFGLYSVGFNDEGVVERVDEVDYRLPQGKDAEFKSIVRQYLRNQGHGGAWSIRLRVEPGTAQAFRIGRSEVCPPDSRTRFTVEAPSLEGGRRPVPPRLRVSVDANGNVTDLHILRGSGSDELDRWVEETLRRRQYSPGLVDGIAVPMDRDETVQFRTRG